MSPASDGRHNVVVHRERPCQGWDNDQEHSPPSQGLQVLLSQADVGRYERKGEVRRCHEHRRCADCRIAQGVPMPNILVVDDDPGTLETFDQILRQAGLKVALAETGEGALRLARQSRFDLVLADLRLPDMTGVDILKQLRSNKETVTFIVMTGFGSAESAFEAGRLGVAAYVEKPIFADHLMRLVTVHARDTMQALRDDTTLSSALRRVMHASQIIERQYMRPDLTLRCVSAQVGVSKEHLCRVLRQTTGGTFSHLLRQTRVHAACRLIDSTSLSMKEIAYRVGFTSPSRFDQNFRDVHGRSPTQHRASLRRPQDG